MKCLFRLGKAKKGAERCGKEANAMVEGTSYCFEHASEVRDDKDQGDWA